MDTVSIFPANIIGRNFIPNEYLPDGKDEYYHRNKQILWQKERWRHLRSDEVERLVKNNNTSDNWDEILVTDQGDDTAIHDVCYLSHFIIGDRCILSNIDEMHTTNHAKFGNGIVKEGEPEKVRMWLDLMNETACRRVLPFDGIISADAYIWAKYQDDAALQEKLKEITQNSFDSRRGFYGTIGNQLVNGIIGFGCHIFYGCKAVRFVLGNNSNLKYGARLIHSFLGDNSTISCCEALNNLIFPAHEQHHNNSFLVASVVMGQSNVAAGATIGSNHNSRANDNEIQAGRGFWPGLCTSVKHSCRFASFVLLSKADYPAELDIPLNLILWRLILLRKYLMLVNYWKYGRQKPLYAAKAIQ
jgi:hypothetical protein